MSADRPEQAVVTVFANQRRYSLGKSRHDQLSWFGGPGSDGVMDGPRHGPRRLHHVVTLNHGAFGIKALRFGFQVSLYYGLCFEGCEVEWQRTASAALKITKLEPRKSSSEYPYYGYPDLLPWFPLQITGAEETTTMDIDEAIGNTGWTPDPAKVYVIAHSHAELGIALFAPGDDVDIVFEYDFEKGSVRAANQCD
jgi:hypothetical protein